MASYFFSSSCFSDLTVENSVKHLALCTVYTNKSEIMILLQGLFDINVDLEGNGQYSKLVVNPLKEHFNIIAESGVISSLRNLEKGVWEQIYGQLNPEQIEAITDLIDKRYGYIRN